MTVTLFRAIHLVVKDTGSEGEEEVVELDQEPSEPHNVQEEDVEEAGDEAEGSSTARPAAGRDEDDDELEDGPGTRYVITVNNVVFPPALYV